MRFGKAWGMEHRERSETGETGGRARRGSNDRRQRTDYSRQLAAGSWQIQGDEETRRHGNFRFEIADCRFVIKKTGGRTKVSAFSL
jgi:hypothetical protein